MKLLYGTWNEGKLLAMKRALISLPVEIIGLKDLDCKVSMAEESGTTPLENARLKAKTYYDVFRMPVFSCDTGLYLEGLQPEYQPGIYVRRPLGYPMTDQEMMEYYSGLAKKFGPIRARYRNAVCFYRDEEHIYESEEENLSGEVFLLAAEPHPDYQPGFPLDRYSVQISSGKYYYDLPGEAQDKVALKNGFLEFFEKIFNSQKIE